MTATAAHGSRRGASARAPWLRERGMGASILVSAISTAFGVVLLSTTGFISALLQASPELRDSDTLATVLTVMAGVLVGLAVYVAGAVTANTFSTVIAGRTRQIALLRLIGASARSQRREVARQGLVVGVLGAVAGLIGGTIVSWLGVVVAQSALGLGDLRFDVVRPVLLIPAAIVALTTWTAAWAGSRRVLSVTALQAIGGSVETAHETIARRTGRNALAIVVFSIGVVVLAFGVLVGFLTPQAVVITFFGGVLSFTGIVLGAALVMPPLLRAVGRLFGGSATARLAAENAMRYPERSSRMAIGVVIGVTLVTTMAVATASTRTVLTNAAGGHLNPAVSSMLDTFSAIMMGLIGVSAVIAAVGLVNLLTLGVVQRRRELGLLRALGLTNGQVRRLVLLEAAHVTITAVATGLVLGIAYGWAGAQSLLSTVPPEPGSVAQATLIWPTVPVWPIVVIVAGAAVLTLAAAVVPTRLATRVAPIAALSQ